MSSTRPNAEPEPISAKKSRPLWPWVAGTLFLSVAAVVFSFWWPMHRANRVLQGLSADSSLTAALITEVDISYHHPQWAGYLLDEKTFHPWFDELVSLNALQRPVPSSLLDDLRQFRDLKTLNVLIEDMPLEKFRDFESLENLGLFGSEVPREGPVRNLKREEWEQLVTELPVESLGFYHFGLSGSRVPNANIEQLYLVLCEIDGSFGKALAGLSELKSLYISDSRAEQGFWKSVSDHPALTILRLTDLTVTGENWRQLCRSERLKTLELDFPWEPPQIDPFTPSPSRELPTESALDNAEWEQLSRLKNLEELSLRDVQITENTLQAIAALPRLRELGLDYVSVDADSLEALGNSLTLKVLHLYETDLTADVLREFIGQHPDVEVNHDLSELELGNSRRAKQMIIAP